MGKIPWVWQPGILVRLASLALVLGTFVNLAAASEDELVYSFPLVPATQAPPEAFLPARGASGVVPTAALESVPADGLLPDLATAGMAEADDDASIVVRNGQTLEDRPWDWQVLPAGLIYHSYLAGEKESRIGCSWNYERDWGWMWDITLGGRVGLLRYGNDDPESPEGFQIDIEGAAQPRLDMEHMEDVLATDFRFGVPITYGVGPFQTKVGFYHFCSHLGDEYLIRLGSFDRINYVRNALVWGNSYYWTQKIRLYGEAGWAFDCDGGAKPWEFQFGVEYAPQKPTGKRPVPFVAVNSHLRQEVDYGGNLVVQTGWAWRGLHGQMYRLGMQYYTGKSDQGEFFNQFEDKVGLGMWYDF